MLFTAAFLKATLDRAVKTAAQALVAAIGVTATLGGIDWKTAGSTAALAAVLSVATSIASGVKTGTPSLVDEHRLPPRRPSTGGKYQGAHFPAPAPMPNGTPTPPTLLGITDPGLDKLARADRRQVTDGPPSRE